MEEILQLSYRRVVLQRQHKVSEMKLAAVRDLNSLLCFGMLRSLPPKITSDAYTQVYIFSINDDDSENFIQNLDVNES